MKEVITRKRANLIDECNFGLGLVDGEDVDFLILFDALVNLVRGVALAGAEFLHG